MRLIYSAAGPASDHSDSDRFGDRWLPRYLAGVDPGSRPICWGSARQFWATGFLGRHIEVYSFLAAVYWLISYAIRTSARSLKNGWGVDAKESETEQAMEKQSRGY